MKLYTLIDSNFNELYISNNLFYDSTRINLDSKLENNAIYGDPFLLNSVNLGVNNPTAYRSK